jgi:RNA polymerase sigma factor (TIGR02999 family)
LEVGVVAQTAQITRLLADARRGDRAAEDQLLAAIYRELRRLAAAYMRRERPNHTLQATALVHEAYLKLLPQRVNWQSRSHFFGVAAQQMRRIFNEHLSLSGRTSDVGGLQKTVG